MSKFALLLVLVLVSFFTYANTLRDPQAVVRFAESANAVIDVGFLPVFSTDPRDFLQWSAVIGLVSLFALVALGFLQSRRLRSKDVDIAALRLVVGESRDSAGDAHLETDRLATILAGVEGSPLEQILQSVENRQGELERELAVHDQQWSETNLPTLQRLEAVLEKNRGLAAAVQERKSRHGVVKEKLDAALSHQAELATALSQMNEDGALARTFDGLEQEAATLATKTTELEGLVAKVEAMPKTLRGLGERLDTLRSRDMPARVTAIRTSVDSLKAGIQATNPGDIAPVEAEVQKVGKQVDILEEFFTKIQVASKTAGELKNRLDVLAKPDTGVKASFTAAAKSIDSLKALIAQIGTIEGTALDDQVKAMKARLEKVEKDLAATEAAYAELTKARERIEVANRTAQSIVLPQAHASAANANANGSNGASHAAHGNGHGAPPVALTK